MIRSPALSDTSSYPSSSGGRTYQSTAPSSLAGSPYLGGGHHNGGQAARTKKKLVVVGDGGCGKTCLLTVFSNLPFPSTYTPTVFETSLVPYPHPSPSFPGEELELALWDTAGQEDYDRLRPLSYPETHVVIMCAAVDYRVSLENIVDKWHPEIMHFLAGVPILLLLTKSDLRQHPRTLELLAAQGQRPITREEGKAVADRLPGVEGYAECSALEGRGVKEVMEWAVKLACVPPPGEQGRAGRKEKKVKCVIL